MTPVLKPQAVSDAEVETRPKPIARHSRARSVQIERPQDQGMRNVEMMTSLLRDSSERDNVVKEIKLLKAENARLQEEMSKQQSDASDARSEALRADHAKEIEDIRTSHQSAITTLEATHAAELEKTRSELDRQQSQSSKLDGVENKIQAVEQALHESKARASQNEEELQKKVEDRDQLALVVEDLKSEIDRCQKQLDADVAKQAEEKKEAIKTMEKLKRDMEEERARNKAQFENLEREKRDTQSKLDELREAAETEKRETEARMLEATEKVEKEVEMLRQSNADAEDTVMQLRDELAAMKKAETERAETARSTERETSTTITELKEQITRMRGEHSEELEALQAAAREQAEKAEQATGSANDTINNLKEQIQTLKDEHESALERAQQQARANEDISHDLRTELESIEKVQEKERRNHKKIQDGTQSVVDELKTEVAKLQADGTDGSKVLQDVQVQLEELKKVKAEAESKYDEELQELQGVIERLHNDSSSMEDMHKQALSQKDEEAKALQKTVDDLEGKTKTLERQIDDASDSAAIIEQLRATTEKLRDEADTLKQREEADNTAKERETSDLKRVVEELHVQAKQQTDQMEMAEEKAKSDAAKAKEEEERLQDKIENLEQRLKEGNDDIESATAQIKEMTGKYELREQEIQHQRDRSLQMKDQELSDLREKLEKREQQVEDLKLATKSAQEKDDQIKDLQDSLKDVEEAKIGAESSLAEARQQMEALHSTLETFQADADEKEAHHYNNLNKTKRELQEGHDSVLQTLRDSHATALDGLREGFGLPGSATAEDLVKELGLLVAKKDRIEMQLDDTELRHNREMEEENQKHESAYKELQDAFKQVKEGQSKALAEQQRQREELQANMTRMKKEHETMLNEVKTENEKVVSGLRAELEQHASKSEAEHSRALEELTAEHERNIQAVMEKHAQQIAAVEEEAAHSSGKNDPGHEQRLAVLEAEHAEALKEATRSPSRTRALGNGSAEESTPATPQMGQSEGLGHVFVNHDDAEGLSAQRADGKAETPLAYNSEDETNMLSPTPAYPRGGNRAGSHVDASKAPKMNTLQKENEKLVEQLREAMEEIVTLKARSAKPPKASQAVEEAVEEEQEEAKDLIASTTDIDDPFTTPGRRSTDASARRPRRDSVPRQPSQKSSPALPQVTLEGTLESLRVQTEQLLEVNDDIMAESRRWSRRLSGLRSSRRSKGSRSSGVGMSSPGWEVRAAS